MIESFESLPTILLSILFFIILPYLYLLVDRPTPISNDEREPPPPNSKFMTLKSGIKIRYTDTGISTTFTSSSSSKELITLFCIHGFGGCLETWIPLTQHFQSNQSKTKMNYRIIAIDLPANGWSDKLFHPSTGYTFRAQGNVAYDMISELKLTNVILVSHSAGGVVSMSQPSRKHKESTRDSGIQRVIGSVLVAPGLFLKPPTILSYRFMQPLVYILVKAMVTASSPLPRQHKNKETLLPQVLDAFVRQRKTLNYEFAFRRTVSGGSSEPPFVELMKDVYVPLHIVWSDEDTVCPPAKEKVLALTKENGGDLSAEVSMVILSDSGHYIQHEQPVLLASEIQSFVDKLTK